jgi:hypothetical protein
VKVLPALLTEIFVGAHSFVHDTNASTMLPNFAGIALDEHASNIIAQRISFIFCQYSIILAPCLVTVPTSGTGAGWR